MKALSKSLAILVAVMTLTTASPSRAAVGLAIASPLVVIGGAAMIGIGAGAVGLGVFDGNRDIVRAGIFGSIFFGIVLDSKSQSVSFEEVNEEEAASLGLNDLEIKSFNSELDQINFLVREVTENLSQIKEPTLSDSAKAWDSLRDQISPESFSAVQKISLQTVKAK